MNTRISGRGWAYVGALLGGAVSILANVAHSYVPPTGAPAGWTPERGAVIGAVFWPVALFVAVEIFARTAWPTGARWTALRFLGLLPVAAVAAVVSYRHLSGLLAFYAEDPLTTVIGPLAVDGLMVMATGALIATGARAHAAPAADPVQVTGPTLVEPVRVAAAEPVREPVHRPRITARSLTAAQRVTTAHLSDPAASNGRIAELAKVSVSTVKRHRPRPGTGSPSAPGGAETPVNAAPVEIAA